VILDLGQTDEQQWDIDLCFNFKHAEDHKEDLKFSIDKNITL
jgi:hypothetical protein